MECAIVLAKRGMRRIHLVDAADDLGGSMRWIPQLPSLGEWARVVNYRRIQIDKLKNVEFIPDTRLDLEQVAAYGAELVVVATGSTWATDGLNGFSRRPLPGADASTPHCATPEQIMVDGKQPPGDHVLVYDCDGYFMGVSLAEKLALDGKQVTLVTPHPEAGPYLQYTWEATHVHRTLHRLGVQIVPHHEITGVEPGRMVGSSVWAKDTPVVWDAESIVLVTQRLSSDAIYHGLKDDPDSLEREGIAGVYRIGDCVEPRIVADAIFDGHCLAREIDSGDPARPLPYLRENVVHQERWAGR